jgi:uncharacterized membrane protein
MSDDQNLVLYVASYPDATTAEADYEALKAAEGDDFKVDESVVISRDADGKVDVTAKGTGATGTGAAWGAGAGLVVGLFAPPLLAATAVGAGIGAVVGKLTKSHEEKKLGKELDEYLPANSSAVLVIIDDQYLDNVQAALGKASKSMNKAIDSGDYDELQKALSESTDEVTDAVES